MKMKNYNRKKYPHANKKNQQLHTAFEEKKNPLRVRSILFISFYNLLILQVVFMVKFYTKDKHCLA